MSVTADEEKAADLATEGVGVGVNMWGNYSQ